MDDEFFQSLPVDDEDFDFDFDINLSAEEEEDDDDDEDDDDEEQDQDEHDQDSKDTTAKETNRKLPAGTSKSQNEDDDDDDDDDEPFTLQAELGLLLEEDIEAAITTLLSTSAQHPPSTPEKSSTSHNSSSAATDDVPRTPLHRDGTSLSSTSTAPTKTTVSSLQVARLKTMLQKHYQLLVQQAVLCVRAAQAPLHRTYVSESKEDLVEILDGAVGLLQDLDQVRFTCVCVVLSFIPGMVSLNVCFLSHLTRAHLSFLPFSLESERCHSNIHSIGKQQQCYNICTLW